MNPYIKNLSQEFNKNMRSLAGEDYRNRSYLIALSGGSDSMALAHLASMNDMKIEIAHCNFNLRGEESDGDEALITQYFESLGKKVHTKHFDTKKLAIESKQSIQVIARNLRYTWFQTLIDIHSFDFILTGHHFDDKVETFIINLARGAGLKGLRGIPSINGKVLRPLLPFGKDQLISFCKILNIPYRDDSSNSDNKYKRNFVRNEVLPLMNSNFPGFKENIGVTMNIMYEYYEYVRNRVEIQLKQYVEINSYGSKLTLRSIDDKALIPFIVRAYMEKRNFTTSDIDDMNQALKIKKSGIKLIGRDKSYMMSDREKIVHIGVLLPETQTEIELTDSIIKLWFGKLIIKESDKIPEKLSANQFLLYADSNHKRLIVRNRQDGDKIRSLGMSGSYQKLQDVYTNAKLDHLDKLLQPVFIFEDEIIWVPGLKRSETKLNNKQGIQYLIEIDNFN